MPRPRWSPSWLPKSSQSRWLPRSSPSPSRWLPRSSLSRWLPTASPDPVLGARRRLRRRGRRHRRQVEPKPAVAEVEPEPELVAEVEPEPLLAEVEPEPVVAEVEPEPAVVGRSRSCSWWLPKSSRSRSLPRSSLSRSLHSKSERRTSAWFDQPDVFASRSARPRRHLLAWPPKTTVRSWPRGVLSSRVSALAIKAPAGAAPAARHRPLPLAGCGAAGREDRRPSRGTGCVVLEASAREVANATAIVGVQTVAAACRCQHRRAICCSMRHPTGAVRLIKLRAKPRPATRGSLRRPVSPFEGVLSEVALSDLPGALELAGFEDGASLDEDEVFRESFREA